MKAHPQPASEDQPSEWITLEDFPTIYKVSPRTARRMIAEGEIPASRWASDSFGFAGRTLTPRSSPSPPLTPADPRP